MLRPHLKTFLKQVNKHYEIVIFTASHSAYANEVLNLIDPSNEFITFRLFSDHCYPKSQEQIIKDLRVIRNRDLHSIVIVDNLPISYSLQLDNGIPIVPFFSEKSDDELLLLATLLADISKFSDVRDAIRMYFKTPLFSSQCFDKKKLTSKLIDLTPL